MIFTATNSGVRLTSSYSPKFVQGELMSRLLFLIVTFLCLSWNLSVAAKNNAKDKWQLDNSQSALYFVSIKNSAIAETHTFKSLSGEISQQGNAMVAIDLATVDTKIDIRNQRMSQHLFEVDNFPQARISSKIDMASLKTMQVGDTLKVTQSFTIELHGHQVNITTDCVVVKLADDKVRVSSLQPILVSAGQFGLLQGIEKLKELAKLPSIATAVPVMFNLVFKQ